MTRTKLGFVCFVAARNCMRQQVSGRSSQRHATLPTYYKVVLRTEKVLLCTTLYYKVLLQYYSVLQSTTPVLHSTTPVLLCTTQCYSSTTLYYKVLLQYHSVLQSTNPVLLCTTKYYSVVHSTTPVLLCTTQCCSSTTQYYSSTTQCYSSTTLYYKVLIQYYSVLQSTTPALLCTTKYYSGTTKYYSSTSLYCKVLLRYYSVLQNTTPVLVCTTKSTFTRETLFTMRGVTSVIVQTHQILRLPRKTNLIIDPCHTWNAIYNARSNKCHCPNSPNTAPATKNESHDWSLSHMKRYLQCAEQQVSSSKLTKYCLRLPRKMNLMIDPCETLFTMRGATSVIVQTHQILRLPRKMSLMIDPCHTWNAIYNARSNKWHCPNSPNTAPATKNESHHWSLSHMQRYLQCAEQQVSLSKLTKYCACHEKWISWLILVTHETLFTMRGATSVIVQTPQILRLPRKMTLMINPRHTWNAIYNARSNKWHPPTSPNTAPATPNDSPKFQKHFSKTDETSITMRDRSETIPRMIREWNRHSATRLATEVTFHAHHEHFVLKNTTFRAPAIIPNFTECCACHEKWHFNFTKYCACHAKWLSWSILVTHETLFTMRGATSGILQHHQILRLPRKMNLMIDPCHTWKAIYNARSNKCHCPNSPNTAPATKNDSHHWSLSHMKRYLQCAEQQVSLSKLTKYCACHAKWLSKILQKFLENSWNVISNAGPIREWSEQETVRRNPPRNRGYFSRPPRAFCIEKYNISRSGYHSKFHRILRLPRKVTLQLHRIYCACHAKWLSWYCHDWSSSHMKRYLQCAEQQVASSNITKYCACHAKWFSKISQTFLQNRWNVNYNARPIRAGSEHDPSWIREWSELKTVIRNPPRNRGYFSGPPRAFCIEKYNISRSCYHSKFHRILRLPRKVTLQLHRILRLPRKVTLERHQIVHLPRKVTLERHQIVHLPRKVTLELHQTVHLPRKVTLRYSTLL